MICQKRHNDTKFKNSQYFSQNAYKLWIYFIFWYERSLIVSVSQKLFQKVSKKAYNGQFTDMSQWHEKWKESIFQSKCTKALNFSHFSGLQELSLWL